MHFLVACYLILVLGVVCDDYFVPVLEVICERLDLSPDVAGATFMAAGELGGGLRRRRRRVCSLPPSAVFGPPVG